VIASILMAVAFAVPLLILGLAALVGGRPENMPAIMYPLARGAEAGTVPGGPAIVVAAESVQAAGPGSDRDPLPAGHGAYYNDRPGSLKISAGTFQSMFGMAIPSYHCGSKSPLSGNSFCSSLITRLLHF
jgi:hypothetical protein